MPGTRASVYPCGRLSTSARFIFKDTGPPRVLRMFVSPASSLEATEVEKPPHSGEGFRKLFLSATEVASVGAAYYLLWVGSDRVENGCVCLSLGLRVLVSQAVFVSVSGCAGVPVVCLARLLSSL